MATSLLAKLKVNKPPVLKKEIEIKIKGKEKGIVKKIEKK